MKTEDFHLIFMSICLCACICTMCTPGTSKSIGSSGTGIKEGCELSHGHGNLNPGSSARAANDLNC